MIGLNTHSHVSQSLRCKPDTVLLVKKILCKHTDIRSVAEI